MKFSLRSVGLLGWLFVAAICIWYLYPLRTQLKYGIDLVGGTYLTLEVHTEKAVEAELVEIMQSTQALLDNANQSGPTTKKIVGEAIILEFPSIGQAADAALVLSDAIKDAKVVSTQSVVEIRLPERVVDRIKEDAVRKNIEVLRTRQLDPQGVAEIPIAAKGDRHIVIELPDMTDPQQAKALIGKAAQLEFKLVDKHGASESELAYEYDGEVPDDLMILPAKDAKDGYYVVERYTDLTGRLLKKAQPGFGGKTGVEPVVQFKFNDVGAQRFYDLTSKNIGKNLAIVLDGRVISAPSINDAIRGEGVISGRFTSQEVRELALLLQSGSYVAPVTFEEERQIGPTLGEESRNMGLLSCLIGLGLILLFVLWYYRFSGLLAFFALLYNLVLILFGLSMIGATLTLPGIAGMILTVGMAVDASILIYEQIKEELARGISMQTAVDNGFSGAMKVILDANITTFIVGIVLYYFGTGPIKGFAVTMMLGIIATLITGLFFLRSLFNFILRNFSFKKISI